MALADRRGAGAGAAGGLVRRLAPRRGPRAAAQKVGEEGVEAALAGACESDERLVEELADLWFHSYVLLAARGLDPAASRTSSPAGTPLADRPWPGADGASIVVCHVDDERQTELMDPADGIPPDELAERRARLAHAFPAGLAGYVVFDEKYIQYLTRFSFLATERPVAYIESANGEQAVFVPEFEVARVRAETSFDRVASYPEYPGLEHPMHLLARVLADMGITGRVGADQDGYPGILGYRGPTLAEATASEVVAIAPPIERLMGERATPRSR